MEKEPQEISAAKKPRRLALGWKILIAAGCVVLALWIASEIVIPRVAAGIIKDEITKRYPQAGDVKVSVGAFPAIKLAFKDYSSLDVKVSDITLEGIKFDSIELKSNDWPQGTYDAHVSTDEVMRFFSETHSFVLSPALSLNGDKIVVSGNMDLGYAVPGIVATGKLEPRGEGGKQIFFVPETIEITGIRSTEAAKAVIRGVMEKEPVFTIRDDLPFTVTSIEASNKSIEVKGNVNLEKALDVKL